MTSDRSESIHSELKGFQRRSAEYAFERLFLAPDSTHRFLVADEVGLGKTLVAGSIISRAIDYLRRQQTPRIDIVYICSNQAIARQNIERIKDRLGIEAKTLASRITLLPYRLDSLAQPVNLIALTPSTSFGSSNAEGTVEERIILFRMLSAVWGDLGAGARRVFQGNVASVARLRLYEDNLPAHAIDLGIMARFRNEVGDRRGAGYRSFLETRNRLRHSASAEARRARADFIAGMRGRLARACLNALEPELIILDEFQRFRALLDGSTESGELARHLFEYGEGRDSVRTLLLSATPYKMYTLTSEQNEDDHYRDFLRTVAFLEGPSGNVEELGVALREYRAELPRLVGETDADAALSRLAARRDRVQGILARVMSRVERRGPGAGGDPMLEARELELFLESQDVEAYLDTRGVAEAVDAPGVIEYWKSAPYLLSFMDNYQLSRNLQSGTADREKAAAIADAIRASERLQVPRHHVEDRSAIPPLNSRLRSLVAELRREGLERLLWLPPSLPQHPLGRDFEAARGATKRLLFSSWAMVPRAVSLLVSHEIERELIPDRRRAERYEADLLPATGDSYSLFALTCPSATLSTAGDPLRYQADSPTRLLEQVTAALRPSVEILTADAPTSGPPQDVWYAVAPLLLDKSSVGLEEWLDALDRGSWLTGVDAQEQSAWSGLAARITEVVRRPELLGRPPADLLEVLAALALGGLGNVALRAMSRTCAGADTESLRPAAARMAWALRSLFRSPVADGLLRNVYKPEVAVGAADEYWRRVIAYSIEGGLSTVLEEFLHVMSEASGSANVDTLAASFVNAVGLRTSALDVAEWNPEGDGVSRGTFPMRQHVARRYSGESGVLANMQESERLDDVRAAFNSPFWPFILSTTSVGQEGLDFHWYCHAVVHWNLPPSPVDLEQREGRVHRYHGHAVRKNIAEVVGAEAIAEARRSVALGNHVDPWDAAYRIAEDRFSDGDGLVPHWVFDRGSARILRQVATLPFSKDEERFTSLRAALTVYRMVFGQPRQEDLLEFILRSVPDEDRRADLAAALYINLAPPPLGSNA